MNSYMIDLLLVFGMVLAAASTAWLVRFPAKRTEPKRFSLWALQPAGKADKVGLTFHGPAVFPKRVYEGDSCTLTIDLHRTPHVLSGDEVSYLRRTEDSLHVSLLVNLYFVRKDLVKINLELELLAAGFEISGDRRQRQSVSSDVLRYQWNCYFPHSGSHSYALVAREIAEDENRQRVSDIGRMEENLRVVKLDHLTQRQVWLLATCTAILTGGLAVAEALRKLGVW